ncbi:Retrovirus-related Pol polyprotein, partial [Mucuna pruriens]
MKQLATSNLDRLDRATYPLKLFQIREEMPVWSPLEAEKNYFNLHCNNHRGHPKPTPNQIPTHSLGQSQLSHCHFHLEPAQQGSQSPKYAKFLKELCVHKRRKIKGSREIGGVVSALTKNEELTVGATRALQRKCRDPGIFSVPCTIGHCPFANAMLDLGASINVMPASIYRSLNFGDLEPTRMTIQLANRSIVNELIFSADFYVLDMEDETSGKESTLSLGRPFLMTAKTKIDVHAGMLSMEFGDNLVQFNIFEATKHPTKDRSLFGIDLLDEIVEEYFLLNSSSEDIEKFAGSTDEISCLGFANEEADYKEVQDLPNFEDNHSNIADLDFEVELSALLNQVCNLENPESITNVEYAYLDKEQQLPVIIASNLNQEHEDKLLEVLRQHKKAIGWKLSDLPGINPSICMHKILMEEEIKPIRQQQRRMNLTILDVVKKEVTKLLAVGIIYPISDSQWVSPVQVVPKKSGMTIMKNQQDELVPTWMQNSCRATHEDHFPLPFIDQVLEKLPGKSHYYFLDGFSGYMQIHIALEDQHKTTFTCPFSTFAYSRMPFGLCNALSTIFSDLLQDYMEVFMDDFMVYANSFDACLGNLSKVLKRCIDTNLVLNFEKCHFMVIEGFVLGHLVSNRGIKVDKSKIDIIYSLPNPTSMREVRSFLGHAGFYRRFIKNLSKLALPLSRLLQKDELKNRLTSAPILQAPNWDLPFELMCDASNSALGVVLG